MRGDASAGVATCLRDPKDFSFDGRRGSPSWQAPEKKQAAWEFIKWLQQPAQIARWATASGYLPYTKKSAAAMADVLAKDSRRKIAVDQLTYSRKNSPSQTVPRANDPFYDAMLQIMNLKADPKVIMPQIQKQVQAILVQDGFKK
jgi:sn-glycerol 3-phosphate transport system substrate-binding protein